MILLLFIALAGAQTLLIDDQIIIGLSTEKTQGNIGGFEGADALCSLGQSEPWYAILFNGTELNPSIIPLFENQTEFSLQILIDVAGKKVGYTNPETFVELNSATYYASAPLVQNGILADPQIYYGRPGPICDNWQSNSTLLNATASSFEGDKYLVSCDAELRLLCMRRIEPFTGIPDEPYMYELAVTPSNFSSALLGGLNGANDLCEIEMGVPGAKAILFDSLSDPVGGSMDVAQLVWMNGEILSRQIPLNTLGNKGFLLSLNTSIPFPVYPSFPDGQSVPNNTVLFAGNLNGGTCGDWTSDIGNTTHLHYETGVGWTYRASTCNSTARLLCHTPIQPNTRPSPVYTMARLSGEIQGGMSGFGGADDLCQTETLDSNYRAFLSENSFPEIPPLLDTMQNALFADSTGSPIGYPIPVDLAVLTEPIISYDAWPYLNGTSGSLPASFWTGFKSSANCMDWQTSHPMPMGLYVTGTSANATIYESPCDETHSLLCVRLNSTATPTPTPTSISTLTTTLTQTPTPTPTPTPIITSTPTATPSPTTPSSTYGTTFVVLVSIILLLVTFLSILGYLLSR